MLRNLEPWQKALAFSAAGVAVGGLLWYLLRDDDETEVETTLRANPDIKVPQPKGLQAEWPLGCLCVIHNLQSESGKALNGRLGEVRAWNDDAGRVCVRLSSTDAPANWKKLKPENLRAAPKAALDRDAKCYMCREGARSDEPALLQPCACAASIGGVHLRCLQISSLAGMKPEYPKCPLCKQQYDGRTAVMLLENIRECLELRNESGLDWYEQNLSFLALAYMHAGEPRRAVELQENALEILHVKHPDDRDTVGLWLTNLGGYQLQAGTPLDAADTLEHALTVLEENTGADDVKLATTLCNLGSAYEKSGDTTKSIANFERVVKIFEQATGDADVAFAPALSNLGSAYRKFGDDVKAIKSWERALKIYESAHGQQHVDVARVLSDLGGAYDRLGEPERGLSCCERALSVLEAEYGLEHVELALTLLHLSLIHRKLKNPQKADDFEARARKIMTAATG